MSFPAYPNEVQRSPQPPEPEPHFAAADPEGYLLRHRWGNCLAAALDNDAAAKAALLQSLSWIRNPPARSDAAWEPYSCCERLVNLAVLLAVDADCRRSVEAAHAKEVSFFFADSMRWIDSRLEYYGIARTNNHILNNARALVVAGSVLGDQPSVERGLLLFSRMGRELFQPGGFLRERSSHYQYVVTNWLLDALHFARAAAPRRGQARAAMAELDALSTRASHATALLVSAGEGLDTQLGDLSPDYSPATAVARIRRLYPKTLAGAEVGANWRRDDWLFVSGGRHRLLTCGMPGEYPFEYTTHGHADLCGFIWAFDGRPVLVDAGRASYLDDSATRLQAGPAGHNVLTIRGLPPLSDSLLTGGRWCPRTYAQAAVRFAHHGGAGFLIEHNGFQRIPGIGRHARSVLIEADGISVLDRVEGAGVVDIETFWHFAPGLKPLDEAGGAAAGDGLQVALTEEGGDPAAARLCWEEYPFSAAYGDMQKAYMLRVRRTVTLPWSGKTTLRATPCAG